MLYFCTMNASFPARFWPADGAPEPAEVFVSSTTITIRRTLPDLSSLDLNWLVQDVVGYRNHKGELEFQQLDALGTGGKLLVSDSPLVKELQQKAPQLFKEKKGWNTWDPALKLLLGLGGILLVIGIAFYTWALPWLGGKLADYFPRETEITLGKNMLPSAIAMYEVDSEKTVTINRFYKSLDVKSEYPIQITVVKSVELNAFAIPGGQIVVYDALLEDMKTPAELVALLAHESTHITQRHTLKSIFHQSSRQLFWYFLLGSHSGIAGFLVDQGENLKNLGYSRTLETEADTKGMEMMVRAGVDPQGMLQLMELLDKNRSAQEPPALFSTHPLLEERKKLIKQSLPKWKQRFPDQPALNELFHQLYEKGM